MPAAPNEIWICPECGTTNNNWYDLCPVCLCVIGGARGGGYDNSSLLSQQLRASSPQQQPQYGTIFTTAPMGSSSTDRPRRDTDNGMIKPITTQRHPGSAREKRPKPRKSNLLSLLNDDKPMADIWGEEAVARNQDLAALENPPKQAEEKEPDFSRLSIISIPQGADVEVASKEYLPYIHVKMLGHGASASVEMVRDARTGSVFARKIFRNVYARNVEEAKTRFRNEVQIMRKLAPHHHIIRVHATYIAHRELALVLTPVADDGDLATYLQEYRDLIDLSHKNNSRRRTEMTVTLRRAFGCLASGLAFMHEQTIRHKDIKPQNILIHEGSVLYTDFGISFDFSQQGHSTTTGYPHSFTRRYCAPELPEHGRRNRKADVFSLGCVYVEIVAALEPGSVPEGLLDGPFFEQVSKRSKEFESPLRKVSSNLGSMLAMNPDDRPSAAHVSGKSLRRGGSGARVESVARTPGGESTPKGASCHPCVPQTSSRVLCFWENRTTAACSNRVVYGSLEEVMSQHDETGTALAKQAKDRTSH